MPQDPAIFQSTSHTEISKIGDAGTANVQQQELKRAKAPSEQVGHQLGDNPKLLVMCSFIPLSVATTKVLMQFIVILIDLDVSLIRPCGDTVHEHDGKEKP